MDTSIQLFLYFLAGITLAIAAINLVIALQKGSEKTYLILGLMGICVGAYYFLYSYAAVLNPGSNISKVALLFFMSSFALLPWFICFYTKYCRKFVQWSLTAGMAFSYFILLFTTNFSHPIYWNIVAHIVLVGIIIYGFTAAIYQQKHNETRAAWLLMAALVILSVLGIDDIIRVYFPKAYPFNVPDFILPLDYFLVFFMIIIGLKLARDMQHKYQLERSFNLQESRWSSLLENVQLLVLGVDRDEKIYYVNPFLLELTGFNKENLIGQHYMVLVPENRRQSLKELVADIDNPDELPYYQNNMLTSNGEEKTIGWSLVGMYNEAGDFISSISIGADITDQQNAFEEITMLKSKLEVENILLRSELGKVSTVGKITGNSDAIRYVLQRAIQVAPTDSTVLLEGETGVGKELVANYIQENSQRANKPFIKLNCAAIPATLLESELFGHTKGAFTGADRAKKGMVEMADRGTLFLDEIGEFPVELQPKLLRFLQEGEFQPLGSEKAKEVNVRIIAATNRELLKEIERGRFRNDLYYRIYVYPITIPALRDRIEDISELIEIFVEHFSKKYGKTIKKVSRLVVEELKKYHWPGNIRELENVIERAVIVATSDTLKIKDISPVLANQSGLKKQKSQTILTLENNEREHIIKALKTTKWQIHGQNGAAELLGINPSTLRSRMKKMNISKSD